jgi:hypothetical protein
MNTQDLLNSVSAKTKTSTKTKKNDRPVVEVPQDVQEAFVSLVEAKTIAEIANSRQEAETAFVESEMFNVFANSLFNNGTQPANPRLLTERDGKTDMSGIYQVQNRFKVNVPEDAAKSFEERLTHTLINFVGLDETNAQNLVENEIDATPETSIRPFNELAVGHYEGKEFVAATEAEQTAAQKIMLFVTGEPSDPLTSDEMQLVIRKVDKVKVKDGFFERLKSYCETVEQLTGVLRVITPTNFVSHMKFAVSDTPEVRQERLVEAASRLLGVAELE